MSSGSAVTGGGSAGAEDAAAVALGRKLLVNVAENGHSFEIECGGGTPVEAIQRSIEGLYGIPPADQLLLCGNIPLQGAHPLAHFNLPRDDREVFLYNKARLYADSQPPPPECIDIPEPSIPPPPRPQDAPALEVSADPALKALVSYEIRFRYHFQVANAVYQCSVAKYEVCRRLLRELQVQERALDAARSNLEYSFRKLPQQYSNFLRCFSQQHHRFVELQTNFFRDVQRFRAVRLHPSLQCEGRQCLLDLMKENELKELADDFFSMHKQFVEANVSEMKASFVDLKKRVETLINAMRSRVCKELEALIKEHQRVIGDQKSIMQSLSKDVGTSKNLVDDCSNHQLSASLRPHDAVSAVGRIYEVHEKDNLPSVHKFDRMLTKLLEKCKVKKNEMNALVHVCVLRVKSAQITIKDTSNRLHGYEEVMDQQDERFYKLKLFSGLGHAYRACLAEVVRRKSSFKLYTGMAGQLAEKLATEREVEIRRREVFFRTWSKYIPDDIISSMGLSDSPTQCGVKVAPFDCDLLPIDIDDLEKLAPQSLVGSSLKSERSQPKSSSSYSSTSEDLSRAEQNNLNTDDKMDFKDFLGGCDTVDIAGTSRLEVENARLKAELASAIAVLCTLGAEYDYESIDEGQIDNMLKNAREKTAEALSAKDEYATQLQSMFMAKQEQCLSYEKRIQELKEQLANQYIQGHMVSRSKDASDSLLSGSKSNDCNLDVSGGRQTHFRDESSVAMDETSSTSEQPSKQTEDVDENMTDISGALNSQLLNSAECTNMDAFMAEVTRGKDRKIVSIDKEGRILTQLTMAGTSDVATADPLSILNSRTNDHTLELRDKEFIVSDLKDKIDEKSKQLDETESKLSAVVSEVSSLNKELENTRGLLDESQINCAHLENCLHEAREEARTNKCSADRRAVEYDALRSSALRIHGLFERLNNCVTAPGMSGFADSLRSLALSLASSVKKDEVDSTIQFQQCIKILADKVTFLFRQNAELQERYSRMEAAHGIILRDLEEKKTQINSLYNKLQVEKQASKEKISVGHFEVHELAVFVRNPAGHYEAINRSCSNYFLSEESVALFTEPHLPWHPAYIIGQIVHIERRTAKQADQTEGPSHRHGGSGNGGGRRSVPNSNPYGLPSGCEYFVVTVAMLPGSSAPRSPR